MGYLVLEVLYMLYDCTIMLSMIESIVIHLELIESSFLFLLEILPPQPRNGFQISQQPWRRHSEIR